MTDRAMTAYNIFRGGFRTGSKEPVHWEDLEPWMRDAITVAYLQGKLDVITINKELVTALDATTKNLRTLEEVWRAADDDKMADLARVNCEGNELTLRRARGEAPLA